MAAYTTIDDPSAYFKVQLYTGNGSANHAITFDDTDTDMQPDLVWIKNRDAADAHMIFDSVRGATKRLSSNDSSEAEITDADTLDSFTSDGFQVDADDKVNTNTEKYCSWNWKAGTTSGITSGDITPSGYSFNATSKFAVIAYTGTGSDGRVPTGFGTAAEFVTVRERTAARYWMTYHHTLGNAGEVYLNATNAANTSASTWNSTTPNSVGVSVDGGSEGNGVNSNASSNTYVMYAWAGVQGYSKFGSYVGNGNDDGPFVYTGFRPAFLMRKTTGTDYWQIADNKRKGYNPDNSYLFPSNNGAENPAITRVDLLSNGFKVNDDDSADNTSGTTYIYAAFAEAPFVNSNGVPCNAR